MKRKFLSLLSLSFLIFACEKETITKPVPESSIIRQNIEASKVRIRLRHGVGCTWVLGVCLIIPIGPTHIQLEDGYPYGTAEAEIKEGKLRMVFEQETATAEGIVPITEDIVVNDWLGHKQIVVKAGQYAADFTNQGFGEIIADIEVTD